MLLVDELIEPRWIAPVEPAGSVLENHAIALRDGRIVAILPQEQAHQTYQATRRTTLVDHLVTPGLINLHTHAAMTLLRGAGDDLPLQQWLRERIWPVERALMSHEFVLAGTRLACLEMLRGGVTCFCDMYFFPDAAAQAAREIGMRACVGITVIDLPTAWANDAADYLNKGLAVRDDLRDEPLLSFCLAPHAPYTVADETFKRIATLSEQLEIGIFIHLHETEAEIRDEMSQSGLRPIARLDRLGIIGPQLVSIHSVHMTASEIALFAQRAVTVAHCPSSNLKLGSGIAPVAQFLDAGVRVGLGTDGAASNNRLDVLAEMRLATLLAKGASQRAGVFDAHRVLHAATLAAAAALGLDDRIGSIVVGKDADLVAFDLGGLDALPCFDPVAHLIYVADRQSASHVWVRGDCVVQKRQFVKDAALEAAAEGATTVSLWQNRVRLRFGSFH